MRDPVRLHICANCPGPGWERLRMALEEAGLPVELKPSGCMNGCAEPVALALQGAGRATYFFTGVDPEGDVADILATVETYLAADKGWIGDARPCGRLRFCLKGRVPAL